MISYQTTSPGAPLVRVESETPQPQGTEVLLKTIACGVCHSDIHIHDGVFELGAGKQLAVGKEGMVLGHEIFAEVPNRLVFVYRVANRTFVSPAEPDAPISPSTPCLQDLTSILADGRVAVRRCLQGNGWRLEVWARSEARWQAVAMHWAHE